jgi:predicted ATP-dependent endonuclease of OLD family
VQFQVPTHVEAGSRNHNLPEDSNGLGYQNLISIVFALMSFRDKWMKVGKAGVTLATDDVIPPLHLVLIEEPEAHLHAQVQQVFIRQAYEVLRRHLRLKDSSALRTQLVISTHSSHIAHEADFASLRYFRRLPAPTTVGAVRRLHRSSSARRVVTPRVACLTPPQNVTEAFTTAWSRDASTDGVTFGGFM